VKLHRIFENRLAELDLDGRDPTTVTRNRMAFERMQRWLDSKSVAAADVTETDLRTYLVKVLPGMVAERTAETEGTIVKSAYKCAAEDGLIGQDVVTRRVKVPKAVTPEPMPYSMDEMRRLRAEVACELDDVIFTTLAYAGLRKHELVGLRREDVNFHEGIMLARGKGNKPRRVPLHPILARCLSYYFRRHPDGATVLGRGGSSRNVNARFRAMLEAADLDPDESNRPVHRIRKTAATSLAREGVRDHVIDRVFGWAPVAIRTRYYTGVNDGELHDAIRKLYRSDPIERPVAEAKARRAREKSAA
jgi:integrase/recombinase XerD